MTEIATTRMSSKGQVVIPEEIRRRLRLEPGTRFVVLGKEDTVILKTLAQPDADSFEELLQQAKLQAKQARMRETDVRKATDS